MESIKSFFGTLAYNLIGAYLILALLLTPILVFIVIVIPDSLGNEQFIRGILGLVAVTGILGIYKAIGEELFG